METPYIAGGSQAIYRVTVSWRIRRAGRAQMTNDDGDQRDYRISGLTTFQ